MRQALLVLSHSRRVRVATQRLTRRPLGDSMARDRSEEAMAQIRIRKDQHVRGGLPVIEDTLVSVHEVIAEIWLGATPQQASQRLDVPVAAIWAALAYAADQLEDELDRIAAGRPPFSA